MEYVEAIRDVKKINAIKKNLKEHSPRDYLLFVLGINTGLKISEILSLRIYDIKDNEGTFKRFLALNTKEGAIPIYLNNKVRKAVTFYLSSKSTDGNEYLFKSSKSDEPITRQQAYRIINRAARKIGIEGNIGLHSMRKTFGYHAYKKGVAISLLQHLFGHHSPAETLKYLGIKKEEEIKTEIDVNL
jgi:site-specific recombinase XerD